MTPPLAAQLVREELDRRGWSQNELARRIDVPSGILSRWLTGARKPPIEKVVAIKRLLDGAVPAEAWVDDAA